MSDLRQAAQQALEALERVMSHGQAVQEARDVLRAALAEPEQTPKGWIDETAEVPEHLWKEWSEGYPAPTPRKPLTDEVIAALWSWSQSKQAEATATAQQHAFARAIEAAHGIGEQT